MRILDAMKWRIAIGVLIVSAVALAGHQGRARLKDRKDSRHAMLRRDSPQATPTGHDLILTVSSSPGLFVMAEHLMDVGREQARFQQEGIVSLVRVHGDPHERDPGPLQQCNELGLVLNGEREI